MPDINNPFRFQQKKNYPSPNTFTISKSSIMQWKQQFTNSQPATKINIDNMPVANTGTPILNHLQHNDNGFTVYKSSQDNTPVIQADLTYAFTMPVVKPEVE